MALWGKSVSFKFEDKFKRDNQTHVFGTTAVIEEVSDVNVQIRYAIYRSF